MKDFYKILGVKENASEEEIRARWVELTKRYHPDRGEGMASDEKIREINEAYQILKHSSTRVEYDLQRAYGQEKRGSYFKKLSIPASLLIIFIIVGLIYFNRFQTTSVSELTASNQINQTNLSRLPSNLSVQGEMQSLFHWDQTNPIDQRGQTNPIDPTTQKPSVASKPQRITTLTQPQQRIDVPTQQPQLATSTLAVPITLNQRNQTNQTNQTDGTDRKDQKDRIDLTNQTNQRNQIDQTNLKIDLAQFKPPPLLATEDEVRKFFDSYTERYNRMDIEGFLSLFSSKAVQNQKDGLEGIRKIYANFFNQSKEVGYHLQDMKIEIYQNAIDVKARYEIEQILKVGAEEKVWRGRVRWVLIKENGALKIFTLDYQHQ
jgi:curved DNA-binding protein CbpA